MNRRQWLKSGVITTSGVWLSTAASNDILASVAKQTNAASEVNEIHIINLSHHDYGYTDLPSSVWDYQVRNTRLALKYIEETISYPEEARFRWTEEGLWGVERFWEEASEAEKEKFSSFVRDGFIDVTAMPGNMTCLMDRYSWERELERLKPFFEKFEPLVALQNDVNGLPWGIVDSLLERNVKWITMASNDYLSGPPLPKPSFFWWRGHSGKKILMFNGAGYADGYFYFHEKEWRKGPVPNRYDVWFNAPQHNEIFSTEINALKKSHEILGSKLAILRKQGYTHPILPLSVTNMWTIDNDEPCRQLSEFIKSWNEHGFLPKLVFSTPSLFIKRFLEGSPDNLPVLSGEWCDWWASGIAGSPFEVSVLQAAKRRNVDIGRIADHFNPGNSIDITKDLEKLNKDLVFCCEHTWGAYDSIARPYSERTKGNHYQKFDYFLRCDEDSKRIQASLIRNSVFFKPLSQTSFIEVINPGSRPRSEWVVLSAVALRKKANGVKDTSNGEFFPFENIPASDWIPREKGVNILPDDIPNDVWPYRTSLYRFHVSNLQPGEKRKFEIAEVEALEKRTVTESGFYQAVFNKATGALTNIIHKATGKLLFDENSKFLPGQLIIERPAGQYVRDDINGLNVDPKKFIYSHPQIKKSTGTNGVYATRYSSEFEESFAKKITQEIYFFNAIPRVEFTTTLWLKENLDPIAVYMAFPFSVKNPSIFYDSLGSLVQAGVDQLANTCGLYNTIQNGVIFKGENINIALTTPDAPIGVFEKIERHKRRPVFRPQTAHFFSLLCENYWITNFASLQPTKIVFRHIVECSEKNPGLDLVENNELWAYPCNA